MFILLLVKDVGETCMLAKNLYVGKYVCNFMLVFSPTYRRDGTRMRIILNFEDEVNFNLGRGRPYLTNPLRLNHLTFVSNLLRGLRLLVPFFPSRKSRLKIFEQIF